MKHLQRVTRETAGDTAWSTSTTTRPRRSRGTIDVTDSGSVAIDLGADGETVGIELLDPAQTNSRHWPESRATETCRSAASSGDGLAEPAVYACGSANQLRFYGEVDIDLLHLGVAS